MEIDSMDVDPRDVGATQADAFGALIHALKPFIDDLQLLLQPEFHRFMDLPAELHLQVYNHYCSNDMKSLACQSWVSADKLPSMAVHSVSQGPYSFRTSVPFLPGLCLVNQTVRTEAMIFILRTLEYGIGILDRTRAVFFHLKLETCPTIPLGENFLRLDLSYEQGTDHSTLMARCPNIQVLGLRFSPQLGDNNFILNFNVQFVLGMKKLQQVIVGGQELALDNRFNTEPSSRIGTNAEEVYQSAKTRLGAITNVAHRLKNGFDSSHRKVRVQITLSILSWSGEAFLETTVL
jgi:hypothetical protein